MRRRLRITSTRPGFTLIELLVCLAVIAVLLALLLPAVQQAREAARLSQCRNNLKQLGLAFHGFHETYNRFPPYRIQNYYAGWPATILPYIEQTAAYNQWNFKATYYDQNDTARLVSTPVFYCPSRRSPPQFSVANDVPPWNPSIPNVPGMLTDYAVCGGNGRHNDFAYEQATGAIILGTGDAAKPETLRPDASRTSLALIVDGTSNTLLLGEKHVVPGKYGQNQGTGGFNYGDASALNGDSAHTMGRGAGLATGFAKGSELNNLSFGSSHSGIILFAMCDGSVRGISYSADLGVMDALATRSGGEVAGEY